MATFSYTFHALASVITNIKMSRLYMMHIWTFQLYFTGLSSGVQYNHSKLCNKTTGTVCAGTYIHLPPRLIGLLALHIESIKIHQCWFL